MLLPGEVLRTESREKKSEIRSKACRKKSAEAIVPKFIGKGRTIVSPKYKLEGGLVQ